MQTVHQIEPPSSPRNAEKRAVSALLCVLCGSLLAERATDRTRIKDEKFEQEQTEKTERVPNLRFPCYLLLTNLTADSADTRGWADHLVRNHPRVSASSAVLLYLCPSLFTCGLLPFFSRSCDQDSAMCGTFRSGNASRTSFSSASGKGTKPSRAMREEKSAHSFSRT
jgi:hypothetical protein